MKKLISFIMGVTFLHFLTPVIYSQDSENIQLIGKVAIGNPKGIFIQNNYAYIAAEKMFSILDISNPYEPKEAGYADIPVYGMAEDIFVSGQYAYVAASLAGLRIFDISNPQLPVEVGFYNDQPPGRGGIITNGVFVWS